MIAVAHWHGLWVEKPDSEFVFRSAAGGEVQVTSRLGIGPGVSSGGSRTAIAIVIVNLTQSIQQEDSRSYCNDSEYSGKSICGARAPPDWDDIA
jgi:hypothetical protein